MKQKQKNPIYRVPEVSVYLGKVLDLDAENDGYRIRIDSFEDWNMLVPETAEHTTAGRGRIFLVPGNLEPVQDGSESPERGASTYERWHGREPEAIAELDTPDNIGFYQGRVTRIGYSSDRGAEPGQTEDYDHIFIEEDGIAPKLYTDTAKIDKAKSALIVGGDFVITDRGIE